MIQIKLFDYEHEQDLEEAVNAFLETLSEKQFIDIRYQVAIAEDAFDHDTIFCFSAMVIYRSKS